MPNTRPAIKTIKENLPPSSKVARLIVKIAKLKFQGKDTTEENLKLGQLVMKVMAGVDMIGRFTMMADVKGPSPDKLIKARRCNHHSFQSSEFVFVEAVENIGITDPLLDIGIEEVRTIYTDTQAQVVGNNFAKLIDAKVGELTRFVITGQTSLERVSELVAGIEGWSGAQAKTLVRTSATNAFAAGRMRQASLLSQAGELNALKYNTVGDVDVRDNHKKVDGLVARVDDPVWNHFSPPFGWNCRCTLQPVDELDLPSNMLEGDGDQEQVRFLNRSEWPNTKPDSRAFGNRPTLKFYGNR